MKQDLKEKKVPFKSFHNKVLLVGSSFQKFYREEYDLQDYYLISNIPFGIKQRAGKTLYEQFDLFLEENHSKFKKIYILYPFKNNKESYLQLSKWNWKPVLNFYNEGLSMSFFQFFPEPNQNKIKPLMVTITKNVSKNKKKPKVVKVHYNVNELNKIKPNSRKMVEELKEVRRRARNIYLSNQKVKEIAD